MKRISVPALLMAGLLTAACGGGSGVAPASQRSSENPAPVQPRPSATQPPAQSTKSINDTNHNGQSQNAGTNGGYVPRARQTQPAATPTPKTGGYVPGARQPTPAPTATPNRPNNGGYIPRKRNGEQ
jgi:hypothetical protein